MVPILIDHPVILRCDFLPLISSTEIIILLYCQNQKIVLNTNTFIEAFILCTRRVSFRSGLVSVIQGSVKAAAVTDTKKCAGFQTWIKAIQVLLVT